MRTVTSQAMPSFLIVNADDFGYFRCISQGIVQAHVLGIVTATGVFGNSPNLSEDALLLFEHPNLDAGVHLNLTFGDPLTEGLLRNAPQLNGRFPSKLELVRLLITNTIKPMDVEAEWAAQIEKCLNIGLQIRFMNSHEHIHMLPSLTGVVRRLASRFEIRYIRIPRVDSIRFWMPGTFVRDVGLSILGWQARLASDHSSIGFLGMGASGQLSVEYLATQLKTLQPGKIFELMCHPGIYDKTEISDPRLVQYHNWEQERGVLTSDEVRGLLELHNVKLIGFRDIENV